ncbi:MAG: TIGR01777 family oxidoreductase [Pseudomonadota bacterium]
MTDPLLWTLISIQIAMGLFDTLFHHELTERLPWRASQKLELRLHGVRNFFYGVIFISLAWTEPHGAIAAALTLLLVLEVMITLWDFVEEDLSRKLPWTERINHTLLTLNYGAILALLAPILWQWIRQPTALTPVSYGWWSVMASLAAVGVVVFAARDLLAAARSDRLSRGNPADLVSDLPSHRHFLVTGGTGFVGSRLVDALVSAGHYVTVLTRDPGKAGTLRQPVRAITSLDQIGTHERFDAMVNLAGDPIANGLWNAKKRARIIRSRVETTAALEALVARLDHKPECLISGSAIGWYGPHGDEVVTEKSDPAPAFTQEVCAQWEQAAAKIASQGVRVVRLRMGLVLGVDGGMLAQLLTPFEFGGGARLGDGRQWMSWIEQDDLIRVIAHAIADTTLSGPVNATAPCPVRNDTFTRALGKALRRPAILRIPAWVLTWVLGDMARETMLVSQRVIPKKLTGHGFEFRHSEIVPMLQKITGAKTGTSGTVPGKTNETGAVIAKP